MPFDKVPDYVKESSAQSLYPFEPYWPGGADRDTDGAAPRPLRICVTGAGGFIAAHLCKRLLAEGHVVIACDWKKQEP